MRGTAYNITAAAPIEPSIFHIEDIERLTPKRRAKLVAAAYDLLLDKIRLQAHTRST